MIENKNLKVRSVRFSDEQWTQIKKSAQAEGFKNPSEYIRKKINTKPFNDEKKR